MRKADKSKLLMVIGISLLFSIAGCVDTGVQTIPDSIVYNSQLKFVNLIAGGVKPTFILSGQSKGVIDSSSLGPVDFGNEIPQEADPFMNIQAGSKTLYVVLPNSYVGEFKFSADTDYKTRIFIAGSAADTSFELYKISERLILQTSFPADSGAIAFFNGSPGAVIDTIQITGNGVDSTITPGLALGNAIPYMLFKNGTYAFNVTYTTPDTSLHTNFNKELQPKGRYTAVFYDMADNLQHKVLIDD